MSAIEPFDVLIVGGGMVGASLACALGGSDLSVAVVEAQHPGGDGPAGLDTRSIALAEGTRRIFAALGIWGDLRAAAAPIRRVHISDRGRFGVTRLDASRFGFEALGYVADFGLLNRVIANHAAAQPNVRTFCPAQVQDLEIGETHARVRVTVDGDEQELHARLVVAADGVRSVVRELLAIEVVRWDYGQTALIANLETERPHEGTAYERFTDTGPVALLPLPGQGEKHNRCGAVWTVRSHRAPQLMAASDDEFRAALQERFGFRLGRFGRVSARQAHALALVRAREHVRPRVALIGNAAHTLHPVAGQGFNLGIRDVAVLAELLAGAAGRDVGDLQLLKRYARWRVRDQRSMIAFTDGLARVFSNPLPGVGLVRDLGLLAVDLVPPLKRVLLRHTMGIAGTLPRLSRELTLPRPAREDRS